jgi:hypothetical protein
MIIVGRPPLSVGTYGSISIAPYGTGYRARTLYRDYDGVATCRAAWADQRRS